MKTGDNSTSQTQSSEVLKDLQEKPIGIEEEGNLVGVVLSLSEYERLTAIEKKQPMPNTRELKVLKHFDHKSNKLNMLKINKSSFTNPFILLHLIIELCTLELIIIKEIKVNGLQSLLPVRNY